MEEKPQEIGSPFLEIPRYLSNIYFVLLLIFGIVLFDDLGLVVFQRGLLDTDFSELVSLSNMPFLLLFLAVFGVVNAWVSPLVDAIVYEVCNCLFFRAYKKSKDKIRMDSLLEIALITENSFLLEYFNEKCKANSKMKRLSCAACSLLLSIVFNIILTFEHKGTVISYIPVVYGNCSMSVKIATTVLLVAVFLAMLAGINYTVSNDQSEVYFPDAKYNELAEQKEL
jgi:hypothetical protein